MAFNKTNKEQTGAVTLTKVSPINNDTEMNGSVAVVSPDAEEEKTKTKEEQPNMVGILELVSHVYQWTTFIR